MLAYYSTRKSKSSRRIIPHKYGHVDIQLASSAINPIMVHLEKPLLLNPGYAVCKNDSPPTIIAFLIIAPHYFSKRLKFREMHTSNSLFRLVFAVGLSKNETINKQLRQEFLTYNDLIVGDFYDSYFNMTTKLMMSFKWIDEFCPNASFTLRLNDDVVFNTTELVEYLNREKQRGVLTTNSLICTRFLCDQSNVIRNQSDVDYVSFEEWKYNQYLPYCYGDGYALSNDMNRILYEANLRYFQPPFSVWLEDVLMGILVHLTNSKIRATEKNLTPKMDD